MDLKRKIGPLPLWAWILILGTAGGLLWYEHSKSSSSTSSANQVDPATGLTYAQEQAEAASGVDPLTGATYASEENPGGSTAGDWGGYSPSDYAGGSGLTDTSTTSTPEASFAGEISDVVAGIQALQAAGLVAQPATASSTTTASAPAAAAPAKASTSSKAASTKQTAKPAKTKASGSTTKKKVTTSRSTPNPSRLKNRQGQ